MTLEWIVESMSVWDGNIDMAEIYFTKNVTVAPRAMLIYARVYILRHLLK